MFDVAGVGVGLVITRIVIEARDQNLLSMRPSLVLSRREIGSFVEQRQTEVPAKRLLISAVVLAAHLLLFERAERCEKDLLKVFDGLECQPQGFCQSS